MSSRLARCSVLGFGIASAAVAINMLVVESDRGDGRTLRLASAKLTADERQRKLSLEEGRAAKGAITSSGREKSQGNVVRLGQYAPTSGEIEPTPAAVPAPITVDLVRSLQRELKRRGYEPGSIDGTLGDVTRAAIMAFEDDQGLEITAMPSDELLAALRSGQIGALRRADPTNEERRGTAADITRMVQDALTRLGYSAGVSSGQKNEETERAIRSFEKEQGLVPSGRISGELMMRLFNASAGKRVAQQPAPARRR